MARKKLLQMLEEMRRTKKNEISEELMEELRRGVLLVPAVLPRDTSPEAMRQFLASYGKNNPMPHGLKPQPCLIQNEKGEEFLPLFTSQEEINRGGGNFPFTLNLSFDAATDMLRQRGSLAGVVINPFSHNMVLRMNRDKVKKGTGDPSAGQAAQTEEVTLEQYHALIRRDMEFGFLPGKLFEGKGELIEKICGEKGTFLRELYEELYREEIACPYTPEDFDVLSLAISDTLQITQLSMPEKNRYPHLSRSVIVGYDEKAQRIWYYAIVYEGRGKSSSLVQLMEGGETKHLGEAPAEGSEITRVLQLIEEDQEGE